MNYFKINRLGNRLILALCFCTITFILSYIYFDNREIMSELLVVNTIYLNDGNLFTSNYFGLYFYDGLRYSSHLGIHGFLFSIPTLLGFEVNNQYIYLFIFVVGFINNYILVSISYLLRDKYSTIGAILFFLTMYLNPILFLNSNNLYWLHFMLFVPFYFTLKHFDVNNYKISNFYLLLGMLFSLKYMFTYEFISTMIMACLIPISFSIIRNKKGLKSFFKHMFYLFLASVIPFILIFGISTKFNVNVDQTNSLPITKILTYMGVSDSNPEMQDLVGKVIVRDDKYALVSKYLNSTKDLNESTSAYRKSYTGYFDLLRYIRFDNMLSLIYSSQLILYFSLLLLLLIAQIFFKNKKIKYYGIYLFLALIASFSWVIIQPIHFYLHSIIWVGISDIIFVYPFFGIGSLVIGSILEDFNIYSKRKFVSKNL